MSIVSTSHTYCQHKSRHSRALCLAKVFTRLLSFSRTQQGTRRTHVDSVLVLHRACTVVYCPISSPAQLSMPLSLAAAGNPTNGAREQLIPKERDKARSCARDKGASSQFDPHLPSTSRLTSHNPLQLDKKDGPPVSPWVVGLFVFVLCGSGQSLPLA